MTDYTAIEQIVDFLVKKDTATMRYLDEFFSGPYYRDTLMAKFIELKLHDVIDDIYRQAQEVGKKEVIDYLVEGGDVVRAIDL